MISSGDGSGNTTAPVDDPGFGNVGARGNATAVYLGNQWVLTANHVGTGSVVLGGDELWDSTGVHEENREPDGPRIE